MNKRLIKGFFALLFILLLTTACADITIELKKNGSGNVEVEFPGGGFISKKDVEEELNDLYGNQAGISKIKVRENRNIITASFRFKDISDLEGGAYSETVGELSEGQRSALEGLEFVKKPVKFSKKSKEIFLQLPNDLNDFNNVEVILPGRVIALSDNLERVSKNTVEHKSHGDSYIVYKAGGSFFRNFLTFVLVIALVGGLFLFYQSRQGTEKEEAVSEEVN